MPKALLLLVAALSLIASVQAADDNAGWKKLTASDFRLSQGKYYDDFLDKLDKVGKALPSKKAKDVLDDANHATTASKSKGVPNVIHSFSWAADDDFNDRTTKKWYPQGITTSWDAFNNGKYDDMDVMLVSWHAKNTDEDKDFEKRGARVTFVMYSDTGVPKYRHVLLVRPTDYEKPTANFIGIPNLHAGGTAWYGDHLYVMETSNGVRVFDLRKVFQVKDDKDSADRIGKVGDKYYAYGYKYILPQVRAYRPASKNDIPMRFSWTYIDRTTTPDSLLIGEWSDTKTNCAVLRFPLDYKVHDFAVSSGDEVVATEAFSHPYQQFQGGASINGKYFFTQSWAPRGHLVTWNGDFPPTVRNYSCAMPFGPEDMSYKPGKGGLWTLSESINQGRDVFAVDIDGFKGESQSFCGKS